MYFLFVDILNDFLGTSLRFSLRYFLIYLFEITRALDIPASEIFSIRSRSTISQVSLEIIFICGFLTNCREQSLHIPFAMEPFILYDLL